MTALAALICSALLLVHFVVGGQTFTALVSLILRSRRGRDLAVVIVSSLGLMGFALQQTIATAVGEYGLAGAVEVYRLSSWWWALPPVAAQQTDTVARGQLQINPFQHRISIVPDGAFLELYQSCGQPGRRLEGKPET